MQCHTLNVKCVTAVHTKHLHTVIFDIISRKKSTESDQQVKQYRQHRHRDVLQSSLCTINLASPIQNTGILMIVITTDDQQHLWAQDRVRKAECNSNAYCNITHHIQHGTRDLCLWGRASKTVAPRSAVTSHFTRTHRTTHAIMLMRCSAQFYLWCHFIWF